MDQQTPQQQIHAKLCALGIPYKEIKVYGSQVMVTAWSEDAARKWFRVIQRFTTRITGPKRCIDDNKVNTNTCLLPSCHEVWRVWGTI